MGSVVKPFNYVNQTVIDAIQLDSNLDTLYSLVNGNIDEANIKSGINQDMNGITNVKSPAYKASGSSQTTTGSINSGSNILTIASALDFANGQGISINHAGAACTLSTPTNPAVTVTGTAGTTTYQYQIVSMDANGGCTAGGLVGGTSTGNATLSATSLVNPSAALTLAASGTGSTLTATTYYVQNDIQSASGTTTTGTSQASIAVTAGQNITVSVTLPTNGTSVGIYIGTATNPLKLGTISNTGTITYSGTSTTGLTVTISGTTLNITISAPASATGAAASSTNTTGGYNVLSWTAVTSAVQYAVYGRVSGTMNLLGIVATTTFNDVGAAAISPPSTLPSTPPSTTLADTLITTISSGVGTTTLTLAINATTTSTTQTVGHNDSAAIQSAINAVIAAGTRNIYFPSGSYVASGLTSIASVNFVGDGASFVNATYNILPYGMQGKNQPIGKGQQSGNFFVTDEGTHKEIADIDTCILQTVTGSKNVNGINFDRVWGANFVVAKHIETTNSFIVGMEASLVNETNVDTNVIGVLSSYIGQTKGGQAAYSITGLTAGWNYGLQVDAIKQTGTGIVLRDTVVKTYGGTDAFLGMYAGIDFSNVKGNFTTGAILLGNNHGMWAKNAAGTPVELIKLGGDNSLAIGTGAHAGYTVLKAGTSGATIQDATGVNYMVFDSGANPVQMIIGSALKRIEVGAVDSGGVGYRTVRVLN